MLQDKDLISIQEVRSKVEKAYNAWLKFRAFSQAQVDAVVERMAAAGRANARRLAEMAVQETGYGNVQDKIAKNLLSADLLARKILPLKTVGILREIPEEKLVEYGVPVGVVAAILPTTNPTSTAIFKTLIALKAGNSIVLSPHPRANACTCESAEILHRAAVEGGAPEGIIQCIGGSTLEGTHALIRHERTAVILATGGAAMVRAAYSSGKPSFGVGPGNVPVLIERSADLADAVAKVVVGKSFDYGTVCSSEQAIVAEESLRERICSELKANRAYFCTPEQRDALGMLLVLPNYNINPVCVGQAPAKIAQMAGFSVPAETSIIVAELEGVGKQHPLSVEKLSPVLALYFTPDFARSLDMCEALLKFGGMGHTCVIYSKDESRIREFAARMPAMRVLVNTPAPQGSTGITTNVFPSMTLGCGASAGNSTGDNIGPMHLINVKRLAYAVRRPEEAFTVPLDGSVAATSNAGRPAISAAVERYLSRRGFGPPQEQPQTGGISAVPEQPGAGAPSLAADVVDRFLARKAGGPPETPPTPPPGKG